MFLEVVFALFKFPQSLDFQLILSRKWVTVLSAERQVTEQLFFLGAHYKDLPRSLFNNQPIPDWLEFLGVSVVLHTNSQDFVSNSTQVSKKKIPIKWVVFSIFMGLILNMSRPSGPFRHWPKLMLMVAHLYLGNGAPLGALWVRVAWAETGLDIWQSCWRKAASHSDVSFHSINQQQCGCGRPRQKQQEKIENT